MGSTPMRTMRAGSSFQPSSEAIGEVKVGITDFSAQYGRDFTNLNATTKAGTNSFHGELYDFFENDALNALVPINKAQGFSRRRISLQPVWR